MVDPGKAADDEKVELANLLYVGLIKLDASYRVLPAAAYHWSISRDRKTYTFFLRSDLRFSNGDPLTASDFAYGINRSLDPALRSPSAPTYLLDIKGAPAVLSGQAKTVAGVKVLNAHTLRITARWPVPYFLMELTYPTAYALDARRLSKLGSVDNPSWYTSPIASGPYRLKSWAANDKMVLVPNSFYRLGRPRLKQIVISLSSLPATGLYQYVTHNLDVVPLPTGMPGLTQQPSIVQTNMLAVDGLYMKLTAKPLNDVRVRRALSMALDSRTLVTNAMGSTVTPYSTAIPPWAPIAAPGVRALGFAPQRAARVLGATQYHGKKFPHLTLYYTDDPSAPAIAKLARSIARSWKKYLKISVSTQPLQYNTLYADAQSNQLALYLFGWLADYPDPHDWLSLQWQSDALNNNVHYRNAAFDRAVATADVTWNPVRRAQLYNQAQQILLNDAAWIPLYMPHRAVYVRRNVLNLSVTGYGLIPRSGDWADVGLAPSPTAKRRTR